MKLLGWTRMNKKIEFNSNLPQNTTYPTLNIQQLLDLGIGQIDDFPGMDTGKNGKRPAIDPKITPIRPAPIFDFDTAFEVLNGGTKKPDNGI